MDIIGQCEKEMRELLRKYSAGNEYLSSIDITIGSGIQKTVLEKMKKLGKKVLLCTDPKAMKTHGFLQKYMDVFEKNGFSVKHYDQVSSNPTLAQMNAGIKVAESFKPDFIFALGGGSVIDTSKVIACGIYGDPWDFTEGRKKIEKAIPIVACATTSGTGSHITPYAVLTNTDTQEKKTLKDMHLLPKISFVDTDILKSIPGSVVASTGYDMIAHVVEVYTRKDCDPATADFCEHAFKHIREHLIGSFRMDHNHNRAGMAYAGIFAGIALAVIGTHLPHAIAHPISGRFPEIDHGTALAYVLAETCKVMRSKEDKELNKKFAEVSHALGGGSDIVRALKNYKYLLNIQTPKELSNEDCDKIYSDTMGYRIKSVKRSPVEIDAAEIKKIIYDTMARE